MGPDDPGYGVGRLSRYVERGLVTTREAALRAGRYQMDLQRGVTLHTADALVAGTTGAHGAVLVTHNLRDFPMADLTVQAPPS